MGNARFDTILLLGNNLGLLAGEQQGRRLCGKMGGVEPLRLRHRQFATPWYDVLFASRKEVERLVEGTGWVATRFVGDGPGYVALLDRVGSS